MTGAASGQIAIAGAGIAGLTAALAFAQRGFPVRVFERAPELEEVGAGLQLSPNATRLLRPLGVLKLLQPLMVRPDAVVLRDGASLAELARVPLGDKAEKRWGAPYLVVHRADLQGALLARVAAHENITLSLGSTVQDVGFHDCGATVTIQTGEHTETFSCAFLVGADGVHSAVRGIARGAALNERGSPPAPAESSSVASFAGEYAWRTTVAADSAAGRALAGAASPNEVSAFLRPGFHLIAYPVRAGAAFNLVAFTKGTAPDAQGPAPSSSESPGSRQPAPPIDAPLRRELARCAPPLRQLLDNTPSWTFWPVYTVDALQPWTFRESMALIGDAAHAMTPYAAQGAAMAIEDAVTLANAVAEKGKRDAAALAAWERTRRPRVARVARRAVFNRFVWHARGPAAFARNLALRLRSGEQLAADMDWLYGYEANSG